MIQTTDRKSAPVLVFDNKINLPDHEKVTLDNNIPVLAITAGDQDVVKINFDFHAGKWFEPAKLSGKLTNKLMREGSASHSSREIAEKLDYYGATLKNQCKAFFSNYILYAMNKHLPEILPYMEEIFYQASLPEEELEIITQKEKQALKVQLQRNDYLANREFLRLLYGDDHPFGYVIKPDDYNTDLLPSIKNFYTSHYSGRISRICIAGKIGKDVLSLLNKHFGGKQIDQIPMDLDKHAQVQSKNLEFTSSVKNSVQSAIRIGNSLFNKKHKDYFDFKILNIILGGYFGSRLMSNIREDKGYTYGIYSSNASLLNGGYFSISTEVGHEYRENTLEEISKEIRRLREEEIGTDEFELVRNYMISKIQGSVDGPFHCSNTLRDLWKYGLGPDHLESFIARIKEISAADLTYTAQKYLDYDKMYKVVIN